MDKNHMEGNVDAHTENTDPHQQRFMERYKAILKEKCENSSSSSNESLRLECPELFNDYRAMVMERMAELEGGVMMVDTFRDRPSTLMIREIDDNEEDPLSSVGEYGTCCGQVGIAWDDSNATRETPSNRQESGTEHGSDHDSTICHDEDKISGSNMSSGNEERFIDLSDNETTQLPCFETNKRVLVTNNITSPYEKSGEGQTHNSYPSTDEEWGEVQTHNSYPSTDEELGGGQTHNISPSTDEESGFMQTHKSYPSTGEELSGEEMHKSYFSTDEETGEVETHNISPSTYETKSTPTKCEEVEQLEPVNTPTTYHNIERNAASYKPTSSMYEIIEQKIADCTLLGSEVMDEHVRSYTPLNISNRTLSSDKDASIHTPDCVPLTEKMGGSIPFYSRPINGEVKRHAPDYPSIKKEFRLTEFDRCNDQQVFTAERSRGPPTDLTIPQPHSSSSLVSRRLHPQASFLGFEQELSRCESALREAKTELREERKKQVVVDLFRKTLLEVDQMCSEELQRLKKDVERLQPLNQIAAEWARDSRQEFWFDRYNEEQQRTAAVAGVFKSYVRRLNDPEGC